MTQGDRTGTTFGRYELGELLGRGGMGEVYRAFDTKNDRTVALKLLPTALATDDSFAERFRRESQAVARLGDPHIIPIHDYGEIDGTLYLDMRVVEGSDLRAAIRGSGKLAPERVVSIVDDVAQALDAAHAAGLVHRDVKPENILLTASDFAYLVDFGIARAADGTEPHLTKLGTAIGSIAYLAPEIFDDHEATVASDVYSLAVVAFEALTGRVPHPGATQAATIKAALLDDPPPVSSIDPSLPIGFDEVLSRGLARDRTQRYATAGEFASAARAALATGSRWSPTTVIGQTGPQAPGPQAPGPQGADPQLQPTGPLYPTGPVYPDAPGFSTGAQYYPSPTTPAPRPPVRWPVVVGLAAVIVLAVAVGVVLLLLAPGGADKAGTDQPPVTVTHTHTPALPTLATPPPDSIPCDTTVGVGSSVTTCPFAAAVRDAYLAAGPKGQARTVNAYSPATGQNYTMSCVPSGEIVVCRGGNNAVVHIY